MGILITRSGQRKEAMRIYTERDSAYVRAYKGMIRKGGEWRTIFEFAENSETKTPDGKYVSIEAFVNSPEMQEQVASQPANSDPRLSLAADDNKLLYIFTYSESSSNSISAAAINSSLDTLSGTFKAIAADLKNRVDVDNPVVVVVYNTYDGVRLAYREYTA